MIIACTAYLILPTRIIKFDPADPDTTSSVGEEAEEILYCGNGVLGGDGDIYAANGAGQVLKIETAHNNCYTWIGDPIYSGRIGWGDSIVGVDKCIYWPHTVRKFGIEEVFQLIEECAPRMRNGPFHSLW
jgi:hypothetical protein